MRTGSAVEAPGAVVSGTGVSGGEARAAVVAVSGGFAVAALGVWMFVQHLSELVGSLVVSASGGLAKAPAASSGLSAPSPLPLLVGLAGWVALTAGSVLLVVYAGRVRTHLVAGGTPIGTLGLWVAAGGTVLLTGSPLPALVVAGITLHAAGSVLGTRVMQVASVGVVAQVAAVLLQKDDATAWFASLMLGGLGSASLPLTAVPVLVTFGCTVVALALMWAASADTPSSRLVVDTAGPLGGQPVRQVASSVNHLALDSWSTPTSTPAQEFALMGVAAAAPARQPEPAMAAQPVGAATYPIAPDPVGSPTAVSVGGSAPTPAAIPADWYPDPSGQAAFRYWDGAAWTPHTHAG